MVVAGPHHRKPCTLISIHAFLFAVLNGGVMDTHFDFYSTPEAIATFKTWSAMNTHNVAAMRAKTKRGLLSRNECRLPSHSYVPVLPRAPPPPPPPEPVPVAPAPQVPVPAVAVRLFTLGLRFLDGPLESAVTPALRTAALSAGRGHGNGRHDVLKAEVQQMLLALDFISAVSQVLLIETRIFHDPQAVADRRRHGNVLGFHQVVQDRILTSTEFTPWLRALRGRVLSALSADAGGGGAPQPSLAIVFWCNNGRHRSVACQEIFRDILINHGSEIGAGGGTCWDGSTHLASHAWEFGTCNYCETCQRDADAISAKQRVSTAWATWARL